MLNIWRLFIKRRRKKKCSINCIEMKKKINIKKWRDLLLSRTISVIVIIIIFRNFSSKKFQPIPMKLSCQTQTKIDPNNMQRLELKLFKTIHDFILIFFFFDYLDFLLDERNSEIRKFYENPRSKQENKQTEHDTNVTAK